jgi:hypothetical protein
MIEASSRRRPQTINDPSVEVVRTLLRLPRMNHYQIARPHDPETSAVLATNGRTRRRNDDK